ncbi:centromere protein C-like isoform X2 [Oscarella lobularis]|uniref:centromere protein C-like isoform X2 n=1 Tax=Oscarella lobularis TaxID=121494 RepID=UPI00331412A9
MAKHTVNQAKRLLDNLFGRVASPASKWNKSLAKIDDIFANDGDEELEDTNPWAKKPETIESAVEPTKDGSSKDDGTAPGHPILASTPQGKRRSSSQRHADSVVPKEDIVVGGGDSFLGDNDEEEEEEEEEKEEEEDSEEEKSVKKRQTTSKRREKVSEPERKKMLASVRKNLTATFDEKAPKSQKKKKKKEKEVESSEESEDEIGIGRSSRRRSGKVAVLSPEKSAKKSKIEDEEEEEEIPAKVTRGKRKGRKPEETPQERVKTRSYVQLRSRKQVEKRTPEKESPKPKKKKKGKEVKQTSETESEGEEKRGRKKTKGKKTVTSSSSEDEDPKKKPSHKRTLFDSPETSTTFKVTTRSSSSSLSWLSPSYSFSTTDNKTTSKKKSPKKIRRRVDPVALTKESIYDPLESGDEYDEGDSFTAKDETSIHSKAVRRGKRNRIQPLAFWKLENPVYKLTASGDARKFVGVSKPLNDSVYPKKKQISRTRNGKLKSKRKKIDVEVEPTEDESPINEEIKEMYNLEDSTVSTGVVIDADQKEFVIDLIRHSNMLSTKNVDGKDLDPADLVSMSRIFNVPTYSCGTLTLQKGSEKPHSAVRRSALLFHVIKGTLVVGIHRSSYLACKGTTFVVPVGNGYCLKNVGEESAELFFVQFKEQMFALDKPAKEEEEEEEEDSSDDEN